MRLKRDFFLRPAVRVAQDLLGKFLVREYRGRKIGGMIIETEAYVGPRDRAAHSFGGRITPRNKIMYDVGGKAYPYFIYGMHWLFNITAQDEGKPEAVLIRELDMDGGAGPAKLSKALRFDKSVYGYDLCKSRAKIYVEDRGIKVFRRNILKMPRIGIDYAGPIWSKKPWRFVLKTMRAR